MFKNRDGRVRSGWKIAFMMGAFIAVTAAISAAIIIPVTAILMANGDLAVRTMTYTQRGQQWMNTVNTLLFFVQEIIMILAPVIAWRIIMKNPLSDMGLTPVMKHKKEFLTGLLFGIVSFTAVFIGLILSGNARVTSWTPTFSIQQLIYLFLFILVGFGEEIFGRGYMMSVLRQTRKKPVIIIVSAVLFALLHSMNPGVGILPYINLFLVGVLFAYMFMKSGNLWMCIGYHITWNYFQGYVYGFKVSGTAVKGILTTEIGTGNILNGGAFGPEGGLFVTAVVLVGFLFIRAYYKHKEYDFLSAGAPEQLPMMDEERNQMLS